MTHVARRSQMTWTEDRATQRRDPSAAPGIETGAERCSPIASLPSVSRFGIGIKSTNLRGRMMPQPSSQDDFQRWLTLNGRNSSSR